MNDTQEKYVIKYLASISKSLATLVKEIKNQNKLTMAMLEAAEAAEADDIDAEYTDLDDAADEGDGDDE